MQVVREFQSGGRRQFGSALHSPPVGRIDEAHQFIDTGGWTQPLFNVWLLWKLLKKTRQDMIAENISSNIRLNTNSYRHLLKIMAWMGFFVFYKITIIYSITINTAMLLLLYPVALNWCFSIMSGFDLKSWQQIQCANIYRKLDIWTTIFIETFLIIIIMHSSDKALF